MLQKEAIKQAKKIAKDYCQIAVSVQMTEYKNEIKTECQIICVAIDSDLHETILVKGSTFKKCLFLLRCELDIEIEQKIEQEQDA